MSSLYIYIPIRPTLKITTECLAVIEARTLCVEVDQQHLLGRLTCPLCGQGYTFHLLFVDNWRKCPHCKQFVDEEDGGAYRLWLEDEHLKMLNKSVVDGLALGMELMMNWRQHEQD